MGFFDGRDVNNSMDRMFDLNRDGILDRKEQTFQMAYLGDLMEEDNKSNSDYDDDDDDF